MVDVLLRLLKQTNQGLIPSHCGKYFISGPRWGNPAHARGPHMPPPKQERVCQEGAQRAALKAEKGLLKVGHS